MYQPVYTHKKTPTHIKKNGGSLLNNTDICRLLLCNYYFVIKFAHLSLNGHGDNHLV